MSTYIPGTGTRVAGPVGWRLSGTGLMADDLWLAAHREDTGRPYLSPRALGTGLAGALLAELIITWRVITIRHGHVFAIPHPAYPAAAPPVLPDEPVAGGVLDLVVAEPRPWHTADWLSFLSRHVADEISRRLEDAGYLRRRPQLLPGRSRLIAGDPDWAHCALLRAWAGADASRPPDLYARVLAGLALGCGLGPKLASLGTGGQLRTAGEVIGLLPAELAELVAHVQMSADAALLANRKLSPEDLSLIESGGSVRMFPPSVPATARPSAVSRALARDKLGVPSVLFFLLSGIAPLTVAAGVITSAYATTGLIAIPAAFVVVAVVLAVFVPGYCAMSRSITNAGAFYAFISRGLGKPTGVAAALVALLAYSFLQVGLYGAFGPAAQAEASRYLHVDAPWWVWALAAWAVIAVLGLLRVDITGKILGVLLAAEVIVTVTVTVSGLAHPAGGRLDFGPLSPVSLGSAGWGTFGVLAVIAGLGYVGFEQAPVLSEESRRPHRTIPAATYLALGAIAVVYAAAAWAIEVHAGKAHVAAAAAAQGPGLLFGMASPVVSNTAQILFMTSLFAAALAFHNSVWRYTFSVSREQVLPAFLSKTGVSSVPKAASLFQSVTGLAVIIIYAIGGWPPMTDLFFWLGTSGGFGVLVLLAVTSAAVIRFFAAGDSAGESAWARLVAPALSCVLLTVIVVLAVLHYGTLLGVAPGNPVTWLLPGSYAVVAAAGAGWALVLRTRHPGRYAGIGLGANAITGQFLTAPGAW
jgi:amino acid transporter